MRVSCLVHLEGRDGFSHLLRFWRVDEVTEECSQRVLKDKLKIEREQTCEFSRSAEERVKLSELGAGEAALV